MELAFILAMTELVMKYGVPLAIDLAKTWKDDLGGREPTKEDFEALRAKVRDPGEYFRSG